jgi:AcrR family transcriptional regulator
MKESALREPILAAAISIARKRGVSALTRKAIAKVAKSATGTINYHYDSMGALRGAVVAYAIQTSDVEILARCVGDSRIMEKLSRTQRALVAAYIAG